VQVCSGQAAQASCQCAWRCYTTWTKLRLTLPVESVSCHEGAFPATAFFQGRFCHGHLVKMLLAGGACSLVTGTGRRELPEMDQFGPAASDAYGIDWTLPPWALRFSLYSHGCHSMDWTKQKTLEPCGETLMCRDICEGCMCVPHHAVLSRDAGAIWW
jgi:hypothetical protein